MRIGIDATTIYTNRPTGLGVYSVNVINELARLHDNMVVWTVDDSNLQLEPQQVRNVLQPFKFLGDHLFQLRPLWVEGVLPHLIRREKVDILYSTIPNGLCRSPVPHVVTVHDIIPLAFPEDAPRSVRWNFRFRLPKIFNRAAAIVAVSDYTRLDLLRHYNLDPKKVQVISEGYDQANFMPPDDLSPLATYGLKPNGYILYVGNSSPRKNIINLIKAFSRVSENVSQDLVLAGGKAPSQIRLIKECAIQSGVANRVKLLNYVPYRDLRVLYGGASLFAFLSAYEGFGLPVLEAMACGAAVLSANSTSLPEVTGDAALLVDPFDISAIADQLHAALKDDSLRESLRKQALERCRLFSWERTAREVLGLLQDCGVA